MRVVLTYPYLTGEGGMETVIRKVLDNVPNNVELIFFLPGGVEKKEWLNGMKNKNVKFIFHNKKKYVDIFLDTYKTIKELNPNIVITMNNLQIIPLLLVRKKIKNMKVVSWNHFSLKYTKLNFLLKYCDSFLAISSGIKNELINLGINSQNIHLIFNPVDKTDLIIPCSTDVMKLIYVGRVQYKKQKNMSELFNILGKLDFKWNLDIYGDGPKDEKEQLVNLSKKLGIQQNITWNGWKSDVWKKIKNADLLVMTSKYEGFPMTLIEAMSHGIPVLSSDCDSGPEDIINDKNGMLYHCGNVDDAVNKLNDFENGKIKFQKNEIINSIDKFYTTNYIERFFYIILNLKE